MPVVKQKEWVRTPIDAFVLSKLEAKGLKPSPDADRATFIRRATLDVWGVVPTPEEVAAFVNDKSPDAYEKLVDRLLASPRYGERQARRWLDLARYADSAGFQGDQTRPNVYRYRDYVINAFNSDKPYSRFLQEQIAGDELAPGDQEALTATGFLGLYPDNSNSRDLVQRKYQITTDMVDTLGTAILGTTVGCARCHNHKFDKLTQKDYFSLQAFFANTAIDEKIPVAVKAMKRTFEAQQAKWEEAVKDIKAKQKALIDACSREGADLSQGALSDRQPRVDLQAGKRLERPRPLGQSPPRRSSPTTTLWRAISAMRAKTRKRRTTIPNISRRRKNIASSRQI